MKTYFYRQLYRKRLLKKSLINRNEKAWLQPRALLETGGHLEGVEKFSRFEGGGFQPRRSYIVCRCGFSRRGNFAAALLFSELPESRYERKGREHPFLWM